MAVEAVIFPDIEPTLVTKLQQFCDNSTEDFADDVRVATKKLPPGLPPQSEVIIQVSYQETLDKVRRAATVLLEVFADDYATASGLAHFVASKCPNLVGSTIKFAEVSLGPFRDAEEGPQEKRSITFDLIVKGADYAAPTPTGS